MEERRDAQLDNFCESIGEIRSKMSVLRGDEAGDLNGALQRLRATRRTSYRHAGVELARVPGEEKLRVRYKEGATAENEEEPAEPGAEDGIDDGEFGAARRQAVDGDGDPDGLQDARD